MANKSGNSGIKGNASGLQKQPASYQLSSDRNNTKKSFTKEEEQGRQQLTFGESRRYSSYKKGNI